MHLGLGPSPPFDSLLLMRRTRFICWWKLSSHGGRLQRHPSRTHTYGPGPPFAAMGGARGGGRARDATLTTIYLQSIHLPSEWKAVTTANLEAVAAALQDACSQRARSAQRSGVSVTRGPADASVGSHKLGRERHLRVPALQGGHLKMQAAPPP